MDFICLEAGCYPSILHPSSPKMLLEPLEMEATFSGDIHISSCHPLWSRGRKCLGTKCLSQGKWVNPALLSPLTSPVPSTSSAPYLWHHFPSDSPIQQHLSSQDPDQVPPLLGCLADHPVPLGLLPFLGYHSQTSVVQWVSFIVTILEFLTDLSSVPSWLLNWSVGSPKAGEILPSPRPSLWFTLAHHIE